MRPGPSSNHESSFRKILNSPASWLLGLGLFSVSAGVTHTRMGDAAEGRSRPSVIEEVDSTIGHTRFAVKNVFEDRPPNNHAN